MIYKLEIERDGEKGFWYTEAATVTEAIFRTLLLGVDVVGWSF